MLKRKREVAVKKKWQRRKRDEARPSDNAERALQEKLRKVENLRCCINALETGKIIKDRNGSYLHFAISFGFDSTAHFLVLRVHFPAGWATMTREAAMPQAHAPAKKTTDEKVRGHNVRGTRFEK